MSTGPETEHVCVLVYGGFSGDAVEGDLISIDPGQCTPHKSPLVAIPLGHDISPSQVSSSYGKVAEMNTQQYCAVFGQSNLCTFGLVLNIPRVT